MWPEISLEIPGNIGLAQPWVSGKALVTIDRFLYRLR